jgi:hypothetical protein
VKKKSKKTLENNPPPCNNPPSIGGLKIYPPGGINTVYTAIRVPTTKMLKGTLNKGPATFEIFWWLIREPTSKIIK